MLKHFKWNLYYIDNAYPFEVETQVFMWKELIKIEKYAMIFYYFFLNLKYIQSISMI